MSKFLYLYTVLGTSHSSKVSAKGPQRGNANGRASSGNDQPPRGPYPDPSSGPHHGPRSGPYSGPNHPSHSRLYSDTIDVLGHILYILLGDWSSAGSSSSTRGRGTIVCMCGEEATLLTVNNPTSANKGYYLLLTSYCVDKPS